MTRPASAALVALPLFLSACGTQLPGLHTHVPPADRSAQLELKLASGTYNCEDGISVHVEREVRDQTNRRIHIRWNGNAYWLERDPSYSGLPRFEDNSSGLVWIDLPLKSLLLDGKTNKPLANECRSV